MDLRQLDPAIGRWMVQDPVIHHDYSPYSAFDNNPVYWSDPSGADAIQIGDNFHFSGDDAIKFFEEYLNRLNQKESTEETVSNMYEFETERDGIDTGGGGGNGKKKDTRTKEEKEASAKRWMEDLYDINKFLLEVRTAMAPIGEIKAVFTGGINAIKNIPAMFKSFFKTGSAAKGVSVMTDLSKRFPGFEPLVTRIGGSASKSEIYPALQKIAKGDWIKVYQGGHINGKATEIHYYLHKASGQIANPKIKYSRQVQNVLKDLGY